MWNEAAAPAGAAEDVEEQARTAMMELCSGVSQGPGARW